MARKRRTRATTVRRPAAVAPPAPQHRSRRALLLGLGGAALAVVLVTAAIVVMQRGSSDSTVIPVGVQEFNVPTRNHVQTAVTYPQTPPIGGDHAPVWQNCGFYDAPIASENGVHAMEHGAVWITYRPDLSSAQIDTLRGLARGQTFVLISPFPGLPTPVVASAWGRQLRVELADEPRLAQFIRAFRVGPQTPEPGAPCTGGTGSPK